MRPSSARKPPISAETPDVRNRWKLAPVAENRTYNLEANAPISIRQLAETIGELVGDIEVTFGPSRPGDYRAKRVLALALRRLAADGRTVLVSTHDVEFTALAADEVVVLAEGEVVSSGPKTRKVLMFLVMMSARNAPKGCVFPTSFFPGSGTSIAWARKSGIARGFRRMPPFA